MSAVNMVLHNAMFERQKLNNSEHKKLLLISAAIIKVKHCVHQELIYSLNYWTHTKDIESMTSFVLNNIWLYKWTPVGAHCLFFCCLCVDNRWMFAQFIQRNKSHNNFACIGTTQKKGKDIGISSSFDRRLIGRLSDLSLRHSSCKLTL